jgi:putative hydrolase of the HAD superfamily
MPITEALLFDFGGTLDADGARWAERFHRSYRAAGGALGFPEFEAVFRESDRTLARMSGIAGLGFRAMVEAQTRLLLRLLPDGTGLSDVSIATDFHDQSAAVARRNRRVLERLCARWPLAVVSNFTGNLLPCLGELGLLDCFREVFDSAVVGREKPDPDLFELARVSLGARPEGTWMVGDNPEADIRPALALGMRACWLAPATREPPRGVVPTARITSLVDLATLLE